MRIRTALVAFAMALDTQAAEISGTISSTLIITEDSWLTGNVTCSVQGAPCIRIEASNITLWLNGFNIVGRTEPPAGCSDAVAAEDGIVIRGQRRVELLGPGMVHGFGGQGLLLTPPTARATIRDLTISNSCFSGILVQGSDNDFEGIISVRNGNRNAFCGGICIPGSYNRVRKGLFSGNGYAVTNVTNFGIGIVGAARGNNIEDNVSMGNAVGVFLAAATVQNWVYRNMIGGNPPIQVSLSFDAFPGFDIRNLAPEGANSLGGNVCVSYSGAGTAPCPHIIKLPGR